MKFSCDKRLFLEAINNVQKAVYSKSSNPVLEGILINVREDITLTGNNLELAIKNTFIANVIEMGDIVINSKMLGEIIRKSPDDIIKFEADENYNTIITSGDAVFKILGLCADSYPGIPEVDKESFFAMPSSKLKSMIRQTLYCVSLDEIKQIFTGTYFEFEGDYLSLVSVDKHRLAIRKEPLLKGENNSSFIVPGKSLAELQKVLNDSDEEVLIHYCRSHIMFSIENCTIVSRLIEGEFLKYKTIIPDSSKIKLVVDVNEVNSCVERSSLVIVGEKVKSPIRLNLNENFLNVSAATAAGDVKDGVKVSQIIGGSLEIGFNNKYLLEAFRNCECERVIMEFSTNLTPIVIRPTEGDSFLFLILPMRLKG